MPSRGCCPFAGGLVQAGIEVSTDPELQEQLAEMKFLEKSIGQTGKLAILPFVHTSSRDLWQLTTIK